MYCTFRTATTSIQEVLLRISIPVATYQRNSGFMNSIPHMYIWTSTWTEEITVLNGNESTFEEIELLRGYVAETWYKMITQSYWCSAVLTVYCMQMCTWCMCLFVCVCVVCLRVRVCVYVCAHMHMYTCFRKASFCRLRVSKESFNRLFSSSLFFKTSPSFSDVWSACYLDEVRGAHHTLYTCTYIYSMCRGVQTV